MSRERRPRRNAPQRNDRRPRTNAPGDRERRSGGRTPHSAKDRRPGAGSRTTSQEARTVTARPALTDERFIVGRNPVIEALRAGTKIKRVWLAADPDQTIVEIKERAESLGAPIEEADRHQLADLAGTPDHQGVVALAPPFRYHSVEEILAGAHDSPPFVLVLDHIEDPQNLGSLIRTAECAGVHGVLIPSRRAAGITPAVGKASAGAIEHLPVAQIGNVAQEIERLKAQGLWIVGAHMTGDSGLFEADLAGPIALVIGAEGKGLSRLVSERCDMLVSIPMQGRVNSLNASVAGALLMYEVQRHRSKA